MTHSGSISKEILIVDDQPENLTVLRKMLSEEGFVVRPAINGRLALKAVKETPPDLILLDIMMPEMDGFEVCRRLKEDEDSRDIPVIFVSALSETVDKLRGFALGAVDYVAKPFKSEEVLARVNVHLDLKAFRDSYKRLQKEKEALEVTQETVFQGIAESVVVLDRELNILRANKAPEKICFGGNHFPELLALGKGPCSQALLETLKTREPITRRPIRCDCHQGPPRDLVLTCTPLIDSGQVYYGAVLVLRDITRLADLEKRLAERPRFGGIVGKCAPMQKLYLLLDLVADTDIPILITGQPGTGKALIAETIHDHGRRADRPLAQIHCPSFSEQALASQLFGHVKGAFSWAHEDRIGLVQTADGGTLFLEEVGEITADLQAALLGFMEQGEYQKAGDSRIHKSDVRLVASSSSDLNEKVNQGNFNQDLLRRLKGIAVHLPPLSQRSGDINLLCGHFFRSALTSTSKSLGGFSEQALSILVKYPWPGNIEELKQSLEQAIDSCPGGWILPSHLPQPLQNFARAQTRIEDEAFIFAPKFDRETLSAALNRQNWDRAEAARALDISLVTLERYLEKFGIAPE